jgi:hypothetical protein
VADERPNAVNATAGAWLAIGTLQYFYRQLM